MTALGNGLPIGIYWAGRLVGLGIGQFFQCLYLSASPGRVHRLAGIALSPLSARPVSLGEYPSGKFLAIKRVMPLLPTTHLLSVSSDRIPHGPPDDGPGLAFWNFLVFPPGCCFGRRPGGGHLHRLGTPDHPGCHFDTGFGRGPGIILVNGKSRMEGLTDRLIGWRWSLIPAGHRLRTAGEKGGYGRGRYQIISHDRRIFRLDRRPGYRDPGFTGWQPPGDRPDPGLEKRANPCPALRTLPRFGCPDPSFPGTRAHRLVSKSLFPFPPGLTPKTIRRIVAVPSKRSFDPGGKAISARPFVRRMDCGRITEKMNIEHRTSNVERRMEKDKGPEIGDLCSVLDVCFSFDVGRSSF